MKVGITINFDISFFSNGLQQNIVFLRNLINNLDNFYSYFIFQGENINNEIIDNNFCVPYLDLFKENNFDLIILMGFSITNEDLNRLKNLNQRTKFILMQCGNQYIENMTYSLFEKKSNSPVEVLLALDAIWTLPHYKKNISYMKTYYKNKNVNIVPYLWENYFVDYQIKDSKYINKKKFFHLINNKSVLVMEPNLNSSKNCILPLYIVESFEQNFPNIIDSCNLIGSYKLAENKYFLKLIIQLDIYKNHTNFLKVHERKTLIDSIYNLGSIVISHQQDNGLNNLYFDVLYLGLPLLHNSNIISDYGYFYPDNNIDEAVKQLKLIINNHEENFPAYKVKVDKFINLYSIENEENKRIYCELIRNIIKI